MGTKKRGLPELRAFLKENDQRLFDFCSYLLYGGYDLEELILSIFREFGDEHRRMSRRLKGEWSPLEMRVALFTLAWRRVREAMTRTAYPWSVGRDTRHMKDLDEDILQMWQASKDVHRIEAGVLDRLARVDPEFRAPVILRDILGFEDDEAVRILDLRWGVYRHRLHRGRLELAAVLKGRAVKIPTSAMAPQPAIGLPLRTRT